MIGIQKTLVGGLHVLGRQLLAAGGEIDVVAQMERPDQAVVGNFPALSQVGHNLVAFEADQAAVHQALIAGVLGRNAGVQRFGILADGDGQRIAILDLFGKREGRQAADQGQRQDQGKHSFHEYPST